MIFRWNLVLPLLPTMHCPPPAGKDEAPLSENGSVAGLIRPSFPAWTSAVYLESKACDQYCFFEDDSKVQRASFDRECVSSLNSKIYHDKRFPHKVDLPSVCHLTISVFIRMCVVGQVFNKNCIHIDKSDVLMCT